jgi:hypothetical protein
MKKKSKKKQNDGRDVILLLTAITGLITAIVNLILALAK